MKSNFSFGKIEHLCGEIRIAELYKQGDAFISFPVRVVYYLVDQMEQVPVKVLVSVPKKRIKLAVNRNRIKRQMREAYRLNKQQLCETALKMNKTLYVAFNYIADDKLDYHTIEKRMKQAVEKINSKLEAL